MGMPIVEQRKLAGGICLIDRTRSQLRAISTCSANALAYAASVWLGEKRSANSPPILTKSQLSQSKLAE